MSKRILPAKAGADVPETTLDALRRMAESMPGGFFIYRADEDETILYINDVMLDIFGCATEEEFRGLTGNSFRGLVYPDDLKTVEASILRQVGRNDKRLDYVKYRIRRKDGAVRWVDDYGRLVRTEEGGEVYYVFIRDITEERAAQEESLRRAQVIEGLSVGYSSIFLLHFDTGNMRPYRQGNNYFDRIVSELGEEGPGRADFRRVLSEYAARFVLPEDQAFFVRQTNAEHIRERLGGVPSYTVTYRCNGNIYMEMSVVRVRDEAHPNSVVMGFRDVTERIARVQRELSEKMEMEAELDREKRANEIKSSFLFSITHDIRTPMNAITGFTALAKSHMDDPMMLKEFLGNVEEASGHLLALIDDLLEMSSLSRDKFTLDELPSSLDDEIFTVMDMFRPQAEEKKIELKAELELPPVDVLLDAVRFRRLMSNLVDNALKFTPEGGHVTVAAKRKFASGSGYARYEFSVADDGEGMAEGFLRRVGKVFEREKNSTESGYLGTGLGLAITKKILDLMGGSMEVQSEKGKGSTFTVSIPLKQAGAARKRLSPTAGKTGEAKAAGRYRLLLAEDMGVNRLLAETMLREAGFEVESVPDGCDAVDAVAAHPAHYYDAVLMDIQMPIMNGYEATRRIRAMGREDTDTVPIIALSANAREQDKRASLESGMNAHVAKPFDLAVLVDVLNEEIAAAQEI
ncbi:MAG: response regulator [Schwartzia sp.]|nr:response regulator [Schwartzia sp. (in: firmicutes)]